MKVLVTGGTGFIGSHTVVELRRRGHEVVVVGRSEQMPSWLGSEGVSYRAADVSQVSDVSELLRRDEPEAIVHLAWHTDPRSYLTDRRQNVASLAASLQLLSSAERFGCPRVVIAGTCLEDPYASDTIYARTKRVLHDVASLYFETDRPCVACAHIFSVYGPGEHSDRAIPTIIRALMAGEKVALTDGQASRDYVHVSDVATALATITESSKGGQIDVCTGDARPLREVFSLVGSLLGRKNLLDFGALPSSAATSFEVLGDPDRITELGWSPRYTLETGLKSTLTSWSSTTAEPPR